MEVRPWSPRARRPPAAASTRRTVRARSIGKRYGDEDLGIELLCTKAGEGSLSIGDERLHLKDAKPLPSSD